MRMVTSKMKGLVLVTGATGFIGSAILRRLVAEDVPCVGLSKRQVPCSVKIHPGDVTDPTSVRRAMYGSRVVIHAAGLTDRSSNAVSDAALHDVNVEGTRVVTQAALESSVEHLVLISSSAVYGRALGARREEDEPKPLSPYGKSKRAAEEEASRIATPGGLPLTILRAPTVAGEGDKGSIASLAWLLHRRMFVWIGDGTNRKTVMDVHDLAAACLTVMNVRRSESRVYNVGGWTLSMEKIVETLAEVLAVRVPRWRAHGVFGRSALALTVPAKRVRAIHRLRSRLEGFLSEDVLDFSKFEHLAPDAPRTPWRKTISDEAKWLVRRWQST
jgi:dihydroflavonol-4-reductase